MLDMKNTAQQSYVFAINHQGNYFDGIYDLDKTLDLDWDAQWQYKVEKQNDSWVAEIFIPWRAMSFGVQNINQFGVYISRFDESSNTTYASVPANQQMNSFFQQFNKYSPNVDNETRLDFYPYVSVNHDADTNNNSGSIGAELFWQPSKQQRLSATINPDFGQVESDELVVNFSAVESFFSEKRPFFNNNQSLFEVSGPETLTVVHSPRIGGSAFYDDDNQIEIHSAIKYKMNIGNLDLGILSAFEDSSARGSGRDFVAMRGQYSFGVSKLGLSINHVNTPTIDRQATVLSSDLHLAISENTSLNAGIIGANIDQEDVSIDDVGWWLTGSTDITQHTHEFSLFSYGDNLQLNDIGFVKRVNRQQFEYEYHYQIPNVESFSIRNMTFALETEFKTNFQHENLPHVFGAGVEIQTNNEFEYELSFESFSSGLDDLITRGNRSLWLPSSQNVELEITSAEYFWGQYEFQGTAGSQGWEGSFYEIQAGIEQQFNENLHINFSISQYNSDSWIDWEDGDTVNEFDFTEQGFEFGIDYQLDDNQELRIKFEAVIGKAKSKGRFYIQPDGSLQPLSFSDDFSFSENAFQLRYKYSLSKLTAFYLSYGFGGEYEDEVAKFGTRNLYKRAVESKNVHNIFAKIRLHF
jgi:predicted porin